jgi:hypothetical protein
MRSWSSLSASAPALSSSVDSHGRAIEISGLMMASHTRSQTYLSVFLAPLCRGQYRNLKSFSLYPLNLYSACIILRALKDSLNTRSGPINPTRAFAEAIITNSPPTAVEDAFAAVLPGEKVILAGISGDDRTSFSRSTARSSWYRRV